MSSRTSFLLLVIVILIAALLVVGAFALRATRNTTEGPQMFDQAIKSLCVQAQLGTSECATVAAQWTRTPALVIGFSTCVAEYPPMTLPAKFRDCAMATTGIFATTAAIYDKSKTEVAQTLDASRGIAATAHAKTNTFVSVGIVACINMNNDKTEACDRAVYNVSDTDAARYYDACLVPKPTFNSVDDAKAYFNCLSKQGFVLP